MGRLIDLTGMRFGRLLVLGRAPNSQRGEPRWHCRCDYGNSAVSFGFLLRNDIARSCGCLKAEILSQKALKHGHTKGHKISRSYYSWRGMLTRCENPNAGDYRWYGGREIKVCERWRIFWQIWEKGRPVKVLRSIG
jgi:hypothetical protein